MKISLSVLLLKYVDMNIQCTKTPFNYNILLMQQDIKL